MVGARAGQVAGVSSPAVALNPRIAVVQHEDTVPLDLLTRGLADADLVLVRPDAGDPLPDLGEIDGLIVLGGTMSATDDDTAPWLPAVREHLRAAVAAELPTLGICLGAQLLAIALGGELKRDAPGGPERGIVELRMRPGAETDPLLGDVVSALGREVLAPSSHQDTIAVLPDDATWLASSRQYPFQAFRVGSAWGLQFHPEASEETLIAWQARHGDEAAVTALRETYGTHATALQTLADAVGRSFVELVGARVAS